MILAPTNRRIIRPYDKPSFEHTQRYGLIKDHPLARGLVGYWLFNEGSGNKVFDLSGNENTGTDVSSPIWVPGQYGVAKRYDGDDDYTDCGTRDILKAGSSDFSLEVTMSTTTTANCCIAGRGNSGTGGKRYVLFMLGAGPYNGQLQFYMDDNANAESLISSATYNDGKKHHIVGIRDGNWARMYIDGIAETPIDITGLTSLDDIQGFKIGAVYSNAPTSAVALFLPGDIEFVRYYNRALSASEIAQLYREPFCMLPKAAQVYFFVPVAVGGVKELAGVVEISSTVTGQFLIDKFLTGEVVIASTVTGELVSPIRELAGTVAIESTVNGILKTIGELGGAYCRDSGAYFKDDGAIWANHYPGELAGTVAIKSTTSGELTSPIRELAGEVAIESTIAAEIKRTRGLVGTSVIASTVAGAINLTQKLVGVVVITSTVTGWLIERHPLHILTRDLFRFPHIPEDASNEMKIFLIDLESSLRIILTGDYFAGGVVHADGCRFGDLANYFNVNESGVITLHGKGRITNHVTIYPASFKLHGANAAAVNNDGNFITLDFADGAEKDAYAALFVPFRWDDSTDIIVEIDWECDENASAKAVAWNVKYVSVTDGDEVGVAGTTLTQAFTGRTAGVLRRSKFTTKIVKANLTSDDNLGIRIFREANGTGDTLDATARLVAVHLHFIRNKLGEAIL